MTTFKQNTLLAFGLFAAVQLNAALAQNEHDGHPTENAPGAKVAPHATQPKLQQNGTMPGMGHDKMMQRHGGHLGDGQMNQDMPKGAEQGQQHDH
ncbi:hypothetical protein CH92_14455 [Stutzerimonas stutzeri]|uniref:Uncharacterized protein n=1 Tax=Stutzerimonas stutzeri TaxID=316 RepID=W8R0U9_STUST|nr:hypothetical protein [Stutzerimonas stutzeri]AHL76229.1 hypothetical protein CH92_14455 [Stutzerimonas stutzeri]MCQ4329454.1 hypothetical protein [Stutzerimonas stutzeri]